MESVNHQLASLGNRLLGAIIDGVLGLIVGVPLLFAFGISDQITSGVEMSFAQQISLTLVGFVIFMAMHGYLLHKNGQTIGKVLVKTRIVDESGRKPSLAHLAGLRYFVPVMISQIPIVGGFWGIVDVLFIFGKERKCLHDHIAGTRVVDCR